MSLILSLMNFVHFILFFFIFVLDLIVLFDCIRLFERDHCINFFHHTLQIFYDFKNVRALKATKQNEILIHNLAQHRNIQLVNSKILQVPR